MLFCPRLITSLEYVVQYSYDLGPVSESAPLNSELWPYIYLYTRCSNKFWTGV